MTTEKPAEPLSTSDGARCYVAHFFAREMRRHDFATYIATELAADFACALAQYLGARQAAAKVPVAQVRQNGGHTSPEVWFYPETFYGTKIPDGAVLFLGPPAQGIDLGQFSEPVHYWLHAISGYANARLLFGHAACAEYAAKAAEARRLLALIDSQRDAAPGVGNG